MSKRAEAIANSILKHQSKVDMLLSDLFEIDEQAGLEICEALKEGDY